MPVSKNSINLNDSHTFCKLKRAGFNIFNAGQRSIDWEFEFNKVNVDEVALRLNTILLNLIDESVPICVLWRSSFPTWATYNYKRLVFKKKVTGSIED